MKKQITVMMLVLAVLLGACDKNDNIRLISIDEEIQIGQQVSQEINNNPAEYPVLDETEYPEAYDYMEDLFLEILNSGEVAYRDEFPWQIKIIHDDDVLNAFAAPGGFVYVYTGLIKYLDTEDDLAGVLGHEIAHADLGHTRRNIQKAYGLQAVLSILTGNASQVEQIAADLLANAAILKFSRDFESEADDESVEYLASTKYNCAAARSFFQKLIDEDQTGGTPEFLSTHPNPDNRVEDITKKAEEIGCDTKPLNPASYQDFKAMLP
ncbi:M48 family metalloprotease [Porifericola rhodea]|uniref:M48 family metalloprotease n=1 Tax=Porifericola rhodea TaxID=930972 RepID=UPI002664FF28|nr:M48 family metalloprotease [Porifericola rhodea]WKN29876.1 M48 family metalloprotease [Porifericola rhodea]